MMEQIGFGLTALGILGSAIAVATIRNLVRSVLALAVTLLFTAALFVQLQAPFMAGIQVLLYTGGVITLMLFGVMMTRRQEGVGIDNERSLSRRAPAASFCAVFLGGLVFAIATDAGWVGGGPDRFALRSAPVVSTEVIGRSFLTEYLLAFEVLSLLLLAAMIGAIVLSRRTDHGAPASPSPGRGPNPVRGAVRSKGEAT